MGGDGGKGWLLFLHALEEVHGLFGHSAHPALKRLGQQHSAQEGTS